VIKALVPACFPLFILVFHLRFLLANPSDVGVFTVFLAELYLLGLAGIILLEKKGGD